MSQTSKVKTEHFFNALKRIRPVQRPAGWVNNPQQEAERALSENYFPTYVKGKVGTERELNVPPVNDRIIHGAIQLALYPIWESQLPDTIKERKGTQRSLEAVQAYLNQHPSGEFFRSDIKGFFQSLNQEKTLQTVFSTCQIHPESWEGKAITQIVKGVPHGIPQGSPLSPLLADIVLLELDKELSHSPNCFYLRYVDDLLLLGDIGKPKQTLEAYLAQYDLTLSPEKTISGNYPKEGFSLLSEQFFSPKPKETSQTLLTVKGGSAAYGFPPLPNEDITRGIVLSGPSRKDKGDSFTVSRDHFLKTLLDRPHPEFIELLISPDVLAITSWGEQIRENRNQFLHKGFAKALHDVAFKAYVGQVKPKVAQNQKVDPSIAMPVFRTLILGNEILEQQDLPTDWEKYRDEYTQLTQSLQAGEFEPYHTAISKLFKKNYQLRQNNQLPDQMPYFQDVIDGNDWLEPSIS